GHDAQFLAVPSQRIAGTMTQLGIVQRGQTLMSHGQEHTRYGSWFQTRRRLLQIGGLGCLGLNLARLFESEQAQAAAPSARVQSCILLFYYGGPSHLDTWDMKPSAPKEVRGDFRTMATRVPGLRVCEHLPRCARIMDKLAIIRSMHHPMRSHNAAAVE